MPMLPRARVHTPVVGEDLATHEAATAAHGATGGVVGTTNTQTLTNKTINGLNNTIENVLLSPLDEISVTDATTATVGRMHVCSGTSADYTVTLPAVSGNSGKMIGFRMSNALTKLVTLDGDSAETIDGATTRVMWAGEAAILYCDGTEWVKIAGRSIPMKAKIQANATQSISTGSVTTISLPAVAYDNASLSDTGNSRIVVRRAGVYVATSFTTVEIFSGTPGAQRFITYLRANGHLLSLTEITVSSVGDGHISLSSTAQLAVGDYTDTAAYQNSGESKSTFYVDSGGNQGLICATSLTEVLQW